MPLEEASSLLCGRFLDFNLEQPFIFLSIISYCCRMVELPHHHLRILDLLLLQAESEEGKPHELTGQGTSLFHALLILLAIFLFSLRCWYWLTTEVHYSMFFITYLTI
jgi:hypothetical protein